MLTLLSELWPDWLLWRRKFVFKVSHFWISEFKMSDFHKAFEAIDEDGSGEITIDELQNYMKKSNYKPTFVKKWLNLFDKDDSGKITYRHYCETLGLIPREREATIVKEPEQPKEEQMIIKSSTAMEASPVEVVSENHTNKKPNLKNKEHCNSTRKKRATRHKVNTFSKHKRQLRSNIKPGSVLILLSSRHRGKRVIFLKQLSSGLLLVTGPYKINGCPLRRVHQNMVICTKTQLDISDVNIPDHLDDQYFGSTKNVEDKNKTNANLDIFAKTKTQYILQDVRKQDQKLIDAQLLLAIKSRSDKSMFVKYLCSFFTLSSHDYPHKMQF